MTKINSIGFIGLGVMGYPIAGHLARKGHRLAVHNRSSEKAERWVKEFGGRLARTPSAAVLGADFVVLSVGDDSDVRDVVLGQDGISDGLEGGAVIIDHTTISPRLAEELNQKLKAKEIEYLDAPVSGGETGARNGRLSIMAGGDSAAFERALPIMEAYGAQIVHMGDAGMGQATKLANQICIAGTLQGVAEAINFAIRSGIDPEKLLGALAKGAAQSWQLENRGPWMVKREFTGGFAVRLMKKDLDLCLEAAARTQARVPVAELVRQLYGRLEDQGRGKDDFSSLFLLLDEVEGDQHG